MRGTLLQGCDGRLRCSDVGVVADGEVGSCSYYGFVVGEVSG